MRYLSIGFPTLDLRPPKSPLLGGSVVYSALAASRLGCQAHIIGKGNENIEKELAAHNLEFSFELQPSLSGACFTNTGLGQQRHQTIADWPGIMQLPDVFPDSDIIHFAPVAQEYELSKVPSNRFIGVTPQGWLRKWEKDGKITSTSWDIDDALAAQINAVVVSESEEQYCAGALSRIARLGGVAIVTMDTQGCRVLQDDWRHYPAWRIVEPTDDTGAGDIFAATLFVELANGKHIDTAVDYAQAASALSLSGIGTNAIATRDALEQEIAGRQD